MRLTSIIIPALISTSVNQDQAKYVQYNQENQLFGYQQGIRSLLQISNFHMNYAVHEVSSVSSVHSHSCTCLHPDQISRVHVQENLISGKAPVTPCITDGLFFSFLLNALFAKKLPGTCRIHLIEYKCEYLSQISGDLSEIFDLCERGSGRSKDVILTGNTPAT